MSAGIRWQNPNKHSRCLSQSCRGTCLRVFLKFDVATWARQYVQ